MQLRLIHKLVLVAAAFLGTLVPSGTIGSDAGRLLTTFMGFFTAGVLPTISILIGTVAAAGRSVKALNNVYEEIRFAISALISLLKLAGATVAVLLLLSLPYGDYSIFIPSESASTLIGHLPAVTLSPQGITLDLTEIGLRLGQALVLCLALAFVFAARTLPSALHAALDSKHQLAVDEARRALDDKAPRSAEIKRAFGSDVEFGAVVRLEEKA